MFTQHASRFAGVAVCAAAATSLAQGTMTFYWSVGDTGDNDGIIGPGESAVLTLWAEMDPSPAVGFAGSIFDIAGNGHYQTKGSVDYRENLIDSLGTGPGTLNGDNGITGIESFQLPPFFNPSFDASNPIALYVVHWTPLSYQGLTVVEFWSENHQNASVYTDDFGTSVEYDIAIEPAMFWFPAPASVLTLALGALAASRRRRL